ncbi:MAG: response regulator [Bacteroidetes bacterium]|nr:MAG: response regulator [Bacteroidota bacterium]
MIKSLLIFWFLLVVSPSFSMQGNNIAYSDSLEVLLNEHKEPDIRRVTLLNQLAYSFIYTEAEKAYTLTREALELSETLEYDLGKAHSLWLLGYYYSHRENHETTISYYTDAIKLFDKIGDQQNLANSYNTLGAVYQTKGYFQQALEKYFKTLSIYEKLDEEEGMAVAYNNIGLIYHYFGDLPRTIEYYQKSLELSIQINDKSGQALVYNNLGTIHYEKEEYSAAKNHFLKSMLLYEETNEPLGILLGKLNMGGVYTALGYFEKALDMLNKGLGMSISLGARSWEGWYNLEFARFYEEINQSFEKQTFSQIAFDIGSEISDAELIAESSWLLSNIFAEQEDFKQAYEYQMLYRSYKDSLIDIDNIRRGIGQEYEYHHERELELNRIEQQLRDTMLQTKIKRQKSIRNIMLVAFLVVAMLLIIIHRSYRKNKEANKDLEYQKGEIEEKRTILETQNKEIIKTNEELNSLKQNLVEQNSIIQESKDKFDAVLTAIPDLMFVQNKEGVFLDYFSTRNQPLLLPHDEIIGKSMHDIFSAHTVEKFQNAFANSRENKSVEIVEYAVNLQLEKKFFEARIVHFENEKYLSIARDISDRKQAEKEEEVKEELRKKVFLAEESLRFKQNFLANMSHEMRTPLSGILGMVEILTNTRLDEQQSDYVSTIMQSGENLREIINMVLDYSKIEAGKFKLKIKPFSFSSIPENTEKLFNSICKKPIVFQHTTDPELPLFIEADKLRITQVVSNLISNAVKFTEKGSITFLAELVTKDSGSGQIEIKITISDTGKGIAEEAIDTLFQPFSQIEDIDTRHFEGTGLGLAICREIVEMHGGRVGVQSTLDKGSSFWFTFLATEALVDQNEQKVKIKKPTEKKGNLRILLVEDKKVNQKVITLTLKNLGHQITIAEHGQKAIEIFHPDEFDLVLMDIQMPVMDGITATTLLRKKYTQLPPIVGLSANAFEGDREKYMKQGLDEYLTKPLRKEEFKEVVEKFFLS